MAYTNIQNDMMSLLLSTLPPDRERTTFLAGEGGAIRFQIPHPSELYSTRHTAMGRQDNLFIYVDILRLLENLGGSESYQKDEHTFLDGLKTGLRELVPEDDDVAIALLKHSVEPILIGKPEDEKKGQKIYHTFHDFLLKIEMLGGSQSFGSFLRQQPTGLKGRPDAHKDSEWPPKLGSRLDVEELLQVNPSGNSLAGSPTHDLNTIELHESQMCRFTIRFTPFYVDIGVHCSQNEFFGSQWALSFMNFAIPLTIGTVEYLTLSWLFECRTACMLLDRNGIHLFFVLQPESLVTVGVVTIDDVSVPLAPLAFDGKWAASI
ncbi:hypothetical protein DL96DRAFT_1625051 [Flagelloscypha sp. PMI_526]|nr:hypothetical protein DL96DRAFT_1625051 [Flagelloscypha sp. PMI_526]